jgi:hypothetical protein
MSTLLYFKIPYDGIISRRMNVALQLSVMFFKYSCVTECPSSLRAAYSWQRGVTHEDKTWCLTEVESKVL